MTTIRTASSHQRLLCGVAVTALWLSAGSALAQVDEACLVLPGGVLPADCEQPNATTVVAMPAGANTGPDIAPLSNDAGFVFSIDGQAINADRTIVDRVRQADIKLADADIRVSFDGLAPKPLLDVEMQGNGVPGGTVTLQSALNYPAFVERAEMRILDRAAVGGARLVSVVPVAPNGQVAVTLPATGDLVVVHRVYDARGRFDETVPLPLLGTDDRARVAGVEDGADSTALRRIPVRGGAVTVSAAQIAPGATLATLGEVVRPDSSGRLVIQRILPAGDYAVDVTVQGGGQHTALRRDLVIPGSEWFGVAVADLTFSKSLRGDSDIQTSGRLAYYVDGETDNGVQITSSLDTTDTAPEDLFRRLDEKDPRSLARRAVADGYPTFGDDSTIEDATPTSGKFYLRIEKDGNFAMWGDFQATIAGSSYLRNERTLYGAQAHLATQDTTSKGDARATLDVYASQPDQLGARDVFQGTGGSVYFLQRQDLTPGTATLSVEMRDADTGRVIERRRLVEGRDYEINYLQGVITLTQPLSGQANGNLVQTNPGGDAVINLVVQYDYTPIGVEVDGLSLGGRAESWLTDDLRLGATVMTDRVNGATQRNAGVDLRYEFGTNSYVQLDVARSEGPGYDSSLSVDGGLTIDNSAGAAGDGTAVKLEGQADLTDLGFGRTGFISGYVEKREQGFSTIDTNVGADTGDERLAGAALRVAPDATQAGYALYVDTYENGVGDQTNTLGAELLGATGGRLTYALGVAYLDETDVAEARSGTRTDVAGRLTYAINDSTKAEIFGQGTVARDGLDEFNRIGLGLSHAYDNGWTVDGTLSGGTGGLGATLTARQQLPDGQSRYFGYELDPGRAIDANVSRRDNGGKFVAGGRNALSDEVTVFGENTYDIFGAQRSLLARYGVEYQPTAYQTYDASYELGQIDDRDSGTITRNALSFGFRYETDKLTARNRFEYRRDRADDGSTASDSETYVALTSGRYLFDDERRLQFGVTVSRTTADTASAIAGKYAEVDLGYAFRPVDDERLNMLARYRYLYDDVGQTIDGTPGDGPVQRSHVFSVEANYDLDEYWTLGGKLGGRFTDSGPDMTSLTSNDAWLAVANARYHVVSNWDVLMEIRHLDAVDAGLAETSALVAGYRHMGANLQVGVGYNFGRFSDDLTDLTRNDDGVFLNIVGQF